MAIARFKVSYEIVSEESAECGDVAERGWIDTECRLRDAIEQVRATRTCHVGGVESIECDSSPCTRPRWITVSNSREFLTGECESRSLHIPHYVTAASARRIARLAGARL